MRFHIACTEYVEYWYNKQSREVAELPIFSWHINGVLGMSNVLMKYLKMKAQTQSVCKIHDSAFCCEKHGTNNEGGHNYLTFSTWESLKKKKRKNSGDV